MHKTLIRIVLVEPSHPGNIGSVARAMKTMSLNRLYLVNPKQFPHPEASALAANAVDILDQVVICSSYLEAIHDCHWVIGTGSFLRDREWPVYSPKKAAEIITTEKIGQEVAFVFGREKNGLSNEEMDLCHAQIQIPANPEYNSLNLAAAVQIICYELFQAFLSNSPCDNREVINLTVDEKERMINILADILSLTGLYREDNPRLLLHKIRQMMNNGITAKDKNLIIGLLKNIQLALSKIK